jgi:hypothetical protein
LTLLVQRGENNYPVTKSAQSLSHKVSFLLPSASYLQTNCTSDAVLSARLENSKGTPKASTTQTPIKPDKTLFVRTHVIAQILRIIYNLFVPGNVTEKKVSS